MNIKEYINKLFKKHIDTSLVLPTDIETIPTRDDISSDKILVLDKYKNEYINLLSKKKYLTSHDISATNFTDEMLMNFTLFGNLVINYNDVYNLNTMEDYEKQALWLHSRVTPLKIALYINKMEELYTEAKLRLIALKEIYGEITLPKNKQSALLNEIYNLTSSYIILKNNFFSALLEIKNYQNDLEFHNDNFNYNENQENEILSNKIKEIIKYGKLIPNDFKAYSQKYLSNNSGKETEYIAKMERELEIYAYNNLRINELNQELTDIDKIEKIPSNKKILLEKINILEIKYRILSEYGPHELDLSPLYQVKFDIMTIGIIHMIYSPFRDINDLKELDYYVDIVFNKISTNITGIDSALNNMTDENNKDVIQCFKELLFSEETSYLSYDILRNSFKLCLLLSIDSPEKMLAYFDNHITYIGEHLNYFSPHEDANRLFELKEKVPLSTICRTNLLAIKNGNEIYYPKNMKLLMRIYEFYSNYAEEDKTSYKLPEGIIKIDGEGLTGKEEEKAREYLIGKVTGKTLIMPSTLKELTPSYIFSGVSIPKIVLNEGLEVVNHPIPFICNDTESITIPSTLRGINVVKPPASIDSNTYQTLKEIVFTNFEDSIILNNIEDRRQIFEFLYNLLKYDACNPSNHYNLRELVITIIDKKHNVNKIYLKDILLNMIYSNFNPKDRGRLYDSRYFGHLYIEIMMLQEFKEEFILTIEKKIDEYLEQYNKKTVKR